MDIIYEYTRKRKEFGKHSNLSDVATMEICNIAPTETFKEQWKIKPSTTLNIDCIPAVSEHEVNTEQFIQVDRGMQHLEGGWPKEVNVEDFSDKQRNIRKIEMDESFQEVLSELTKRAQECVMQNNAINMFEEYFAESKHGHSSEPPKAKTLTILRDPNQTSRSVAKMAWHPDSSNKIAVAHASLKFQGMNESTPLASYIWDINNPNRPETVLLPQSHLCCVAFNKKSPEQLVGGCYNGLIGVYIYAPFSSIKISLQNQQVFFDQSLFLCSLFKKMWVFGPCQFASVSTDGYMHWWDVRKLGSGPMDSMLLKDETGKIYGGTALEYRTDAGATRFLVGTEQGTIITVERKAKKDGDSQKQIKMIYGLEEGSKHHAPIYAIERSFFLSVQELVQSVSSVYFNFFVVLLALFTHRNYFVPKGILTIGDWASRLWMEDVRSPVMTSRYENDFLTCGCWSPTRAGVFFITKQDGQLDVWDYCYKQSDPVYQLKISEHPLTSISVQGQGKLVALGGNDGTVTILELSNSLCEPSAQEKAIVNQIFEREMSREKNLQARLLAQKRQKTMAKKPSDTHKLDFINLLLLIITQQKQEEKKENENTQIDFAAVEAEFLDVVEKNKPKFSNTNFQNTNINQN
ncbi:hypothetical protein RFI_14010 [Reticulomyxa filosa]|uniref:Uncharacterized protein n=1 Tax=Reticulomyxa filosa TaxID=46433 RepID=X6NAV9_RETFI|nr:hypothetical protein RFI_14010 [Reticulomyxa filosa]|eukprot:ETO23176.1 hypothetical protein RFI_14010 [Reticulomyxa filosa]